MYDLLKYQFVLNLLEKSLKIYFVLIEMFKHNLNISIEH